VHSEADADAKLCEAGRRVGLHRPAPSNQSYLSITCDHQRGRGNDSQAIHPGYGFLSRMPTSRSGEKSGFVFIGPRARNHPPDGRQGFRQKSDE